MFNFRLRTVYSFLSRNVFTINHPYLKLEILFITSFSKICIRENLARISDLNSLEKRCLPQIAGFKAFLQDCATRVSAVRKV